MALALATRVGSALSRPLSDPLEGAHLGMGDKTGELTVRALFEAAAKVDRARAKDQRTELFTWLLEHADEFAAWRLRPDRSSWEALAGVANQQGLHNRNGRPIAGETMRNTWWQVRRELNRRGVGGDALAVRASLQLQGGRRANKRPGPVLPGPSIEKPETTERRDGAPAVVRDPPWLKR